MFHTKKHSSGHAQSELAIVFFFSGEGLSFHWVSCMSWTIYKPLHPNWPLLLYDHGSCANINRKKTYHWYLLIQTIDWNSVQKLKQNHQNQQDSPLLTYLPNKHPGCGWGQGLFQGLQSVVPSIALVRHEPHSAKGSRAQRLAETEVAHRELFTSGGNWD